MTARTSEKIKNMGYGGYMYYGSKEDKIYGRADIRDNKNMTQMLDILEPWKCPYLPRKWDPIMKFYDYFY